MSPDEIANIAKNAQEHKDRINVTMCAQHIANELGANDGMDYGDDLYWLSQIRKEIPQIKKDRKKVKYQKLIIGILKLFLILSIILNILLILK